MQMIQCPNCDEPLPEHAKFCAHCGESMTSPGHQSVLFRVQKTQRIAQESADMEETLPIRRASVAERPAALKAPVFYAVGDVQRRTPTTLPHPVSRPATINTSLRRRRERLTRTLTQDSLPSEVFDLSHDENEPELHATWQKEVTPVQERAPIITTPRPETPRPIILKSTQVQRTFPTNIFFWVSAALLLTLVMGGVFGVAISMGRGLLGNAIGIKEPRLQVTPGNVIAGTTLTLHGTNFSPHAYIGLTRDSGITLPDAGGTAIILADGQGNFSDTVIAAADWGTGAHTINAEDAMTHKIAQFSLMVTGPSTSLRPAHFQVSQSTLDLGSGDPATNTAQTITLTNAGGGQISWQATTTQSWLVLTPSEGTFASGEHVQVTIAADRSNLNTGPYNASVQFSSNAGNATIDVHMQVIPLEVNYEAVLALVPAVLSFTGTDGGAAPQTQAITVSNPGVLPLQWSASASAAWIVVSPPSGTVQSANKQIVPISINTSTLLPGTYTGSITVTGQGSNVKDSPQTVHISATITQQCSLQLSPGALSFTGVYQQTGPAAKTINIDRAQNCTTSLSWTASSSANWLKLALTSGHTPSYPSVGVDPTGLTPGTYTGSLLFSSTSGTQTLPVTFTLGQSTKPILSNALTALDFAGVMGQASPAAQQVTIANNGGGTLTWQATAATTAGGNWLNLTSTTGSITAGQATTINAKATLLSTLTPGSYSGTITITATDAIGKVVAGSPEIIPVTFTVQAACAITIVPTSLTFAAALGQTAPAAQPLTISAVGACAHALTWTVAATTTPANGTWLVAMPATGTVSTNTPASTSINVGLTGLKTGNYSGTLSLTAVDSITNAAIGTPLTLPVTLTVESACTLQPASATSETFTTESGQNPAAQTFTLSLNGACTGNVTITPTLTLGAGTGWIAVTPNPATVVSGGTATFTVTITSASLAAGTYTAAISLAGTNGGVAIAGSPQTVNVTLTVGSAPTLAVNPASLTINITSGTSSVPLTITNSGGASLNWTAALDNAAPAFVSLSAGRGSNLQGGANATVNVNVNTAKNAASQTYNTSVVVTATDPSTGKPTAGSPVTIPVSINITAPAIQLSTNSLAFTAAANTNPAPQSVVVTNVGGGVLHWTVGAPSASWLTVSPQKARASAGNSGAITFAINTSGLTGLNTYTATVQVNPSVGSSSTITVTLTLTASPNVTLPPSPTPQPTSVPTPQPTATPTPTVQPTPTPTPTPTATPTPQPTPTATPTPAVTPAVQTTPTPQPTVEPTVTPTVEPTVEPTATPTVEVTPTATPTVGDTPTPTATP